MLSGSQPGDTKKPVGFRMKVSTQDTIRTWAKTLGISQADLIEQIVELNSHHLSRLGPVHVLTLKMKTDRPDPFLLVGKDWDGKYSGVVRVYVESDHALKSFDVDVDGMVYYDFAVMLYERAGSFLGVFDAGGAAK